MENNNIKPDLKKIKAYFELPNGKKTFTIPTYQRAYSWGIGQCDKLMDDIKNFMESLDSSNEMDPYFFGNIILDCSEQQLNLIDGQQRTTTFYLLFKALLLRIEEKIPQISHDKDSRKILSGLKGKAKELCKILYFVKDDDFPDLLIDGNEDRFEENKSFLKQREGCLPLKNESINENEGYKDDFKKIILSPKYNGIEEKVYKKKYKQKDNKFTNLFRNFKFFYEEIGKEYQSESRLKRFSEVLLEECQLIEIESWNLEQAIVMFNSLNSTGLPLSDADVLSAQMFSKSGQDKDFATNWKTLVQESDELGDEKLFGLQNLFTDYMYYLRASKGNESVTLKSVRTYFTDDEDIRDLKPESILDNLLLLVRNWKELQNDALARLLLKINFNSNFFIASYFLAHKENKNENTAKEFLENLLRLFVLLEIDDTGYSSSKFKSFLFKENLKFVNPKIEISEINNDFRQHIDTNWKKEDVERDLADYRGNLLVFANEYLYCLEKAETFDFEPNVNIEHIMANSGKNKESIRDEAGIAPEDFDEYVNKLGNKILLEEKINKKVGDAWFRTKKNGDDGYKNSRYAIAKALTEFPSNEWTKKDIDEWTDKANKRIIDFIFGS